MTSVSVTGDDLIEELVEENRRQFNELLFADKCLNVLTEFKSFIDFISVQFINHLESEVWNKFEQLSARVDNICGFKKLIVDNGIVSKELLKTVIEENDIVETNSNKDKTPEEVLVNNSAGDERQLRSKSKPNSSTNSSDKSFISKGRYNWGTFKCPKKNVIQENNRVENNLNKDIILDEVLVNKGTDDERQLRSKPQPNSSIKSSDMSFISKGSYNWGTFKCPKKTAIQENNIVENNSDKDIDLSEELQTNVIQEDNVFPNDPNQDITLEQLLVNNNTGDIMQLQLPNNSTIGSTIGSNEVINVLENGGQPANSYKCCDKKCATYFNSVQSLTNHLESCHPERKFICDYPGCHYRAYRNSHLKNHLATHSKVKTTESVQHPLYQCRYMGCERLYKYLEDLNRHEQTVHQSTVKATINQTLSPVINVVKRYKCSWPGCSYSSNHRSGIFRHKSRHNDERPFVCPWTNCHKRFKLKRNLQQHLIVHRYASPGL